MSENIHAFFLASRAFGLGMALHRAAKSLYSLVGVVRGRRGIRVRRSRYLMCYLRGALRRHTSTMYWSELFRGSQTAMFLKRLQYIPRM